MNQQQMTQETIKCDNALPDNTFTPINTIWDQSAQIFATVIDNANLLPDDGGHEKENGAQAGKNMHREPSGLNKKARTPSTSFSLAVLQEEHALWLK